MNARLRFFLVFSFALLILLVSVGSAQVHAQTGSLLAVVQGTDNGIYYNICTGTGGNCESAATTSWGAWAKLPGGTSSAPTLCPEITQYGYGYGTIQGLVVRGTDDGTYFMQYNSGWSGTWYDAGGQTVDQPACVDNGQTGSIGYVYVVVRGLNNEIYFNQFNKGTKTWTGWVDLQGQTPSPPTLVYDGRLELFVKGTDNPPGGGGGIYHKAGTISGGAVTWAATWDSPGGATLSAVSAVGSTFFVQGTQGANNGVPDKIYENQLTIGGGTSTSYSGWNWIGGLTSMAMGVISTGCGGGFEPLIVPGTNGKLYGTNLGASGWYTGTPPTQTQIYDSAGSPPGGPLTSSPGVIQQGDYAAVLVAGAGGVIYFNVFPGPLVGTPATAWSGYMGVAGGSTPSTPAIADIAQFCGT
jgi:hypothetical protein